MTPSSRTAPSREPSPTASLRRGFGPIDGAAIIISNVVGSGIFIVPAFVAQGVPSPVGMLSVWLAGGVLAFAGAMAYAELAALRPRAGGEYVYLKEAFGPVAGFLTGWTSFVAGFSGAIAAAAVGLAGYLGRFIPAAGDTAPWVRTELGPLTFAVSPQSVIALTAIAGLTMVHIVGIGPGRIVQNVLAGLKVLVLVVFVAFGFSIGQGSVSHFTAVGGPVTVSAWALALIPVMFSYSGWNAASYVAEEMRDPGRNVPLAMGIGTVAVVLIYLLMNVLYVYALPVASLAAVDVRVVDAAADQLFGSGVAAPLAAASVVMIAASISAMILAGPRVYYAMARDGQFFRAVSRVHPKFRTPTIAIVAQSVWSGVLVLSGTFDQLVNYTGFALVLFSGIAVSALFVLRLREPEAPRPFKAWGYPVAPLVFVVASAAIVINALWSSPGPSFAGLAIILAGVPVYWVFQIRNRTRHE